MLELVQHIESRSSVSAAFPFHLIPLVHFVYFVIWERSGYFPTASVEVEMIFPLSRSYFLPSFASSCGLSAGRRSSPGCASESHGLVQICKPEAVRAS